MRRRVASSVTDRRARVVDRAPKPGLVGRGEPKLAERTIPNQATMPHADVPRLDLLDALEYGARRNDGPEGEGLFEARRVEGAGRERDGRAVDDSQRLDVGPQQRGDLRLVQRGARDDVGPHLGRALDRAQHQLDVAGRGVDRHVRPEGRLQPGGGGQVAQPPAVVPPQPAEAGAAEGEQVGAPVAVEVGGDDEAVAGDVVVDDGDDAIDDLTP